MIKEFQEEVIDWLKDDLISRQELIEWVEEWEPKNVVVKNAVDEDWDYDESLWKFVNGDRTIEVVDAIADRARMYEDHWFFPLPTEAENTLQQLLASSGLARQFAKQATLKEKYVKEQIELHSLNYYAGHADPWSPLVSDIAFNIHWNEDRWFLHGSEDGVLKGILPSLEDKQKIQLQHEDIEAEDVKALIDAMPEKYRKNAIFICSNPTLSHLQWLQDPDTDEKIWARRDDRVDTLYEYPLYTSVNMPSLKDGKDVPYGKSVLLFGDFKAAYRYNVLDNTIICPYIMSNLDAHYIVRQSYFAGRIANIDAVRALGLYS